MKRVLLCVVVLFLLIFNIYAEEEADIQESINLEDTIFVNDDWDVHGFRNLGNAFVHGSVAAGEILLKNNILMIGNWIYGFWWALPNAQSIRRAYTQPWQWEQDDFFLDNQFGHPYQGALYFTAGRINGFSYYESVFFSAFGSFTWETIGESATASLNDFITTTVSALVVGEVLYRLYVEARIQGVPAPLAFIVNPIAGFHSLVAGWKPPETNKNLYNFQISLGGGGAQVNQKIAENKNEDNKPFGDVRFDIVYGNPFEQDTMVPFRHFECMFSASTNMVTHLDLRVFMDGYLFSFSPVYTEKNMKSTGLTLHNDYVSIGEFYFKEGIMNYFSNALDWTVKYQHLFTENVIMQIKGHAGLTFLGSSVLNVDPDTRRQNFGYGFNAKRYYIFENKKHFKIELNRITNLMWLYPGVNVVSDGMALWSFTDIIFSYYLTDHISLGAGALFAREMGYFDGCPDASKKADVYKLFVGWRL